MATKSILGQFISALPVSLLAMKFWTGQAAMALA